MTWSKGNRELWYFGHHFKVKVDWLHAPYIFIAGWQRRAAGGYSINWAWHVGLDGIRRVGRKA